MADESLAQEIRIEVTTDGVATVHSLTSALGELKAQFPPGSNQFKALDILERRVNATTNAVQKATGASRQNAQAEQQMANAANAAAAGADKLGKNTGVAASELPRLRYALYDVSNALFIGGAALTAFSGIAYKTAIDYQRDFADVARTTGVTGDAATKLQQGLLRLSQTEPISYKDITSIATMAGQLGVANNRIASFTDTTAKFSATTDVSVNDSATAFGRLDALLPDVEGNYNKLGSSILNVGVNSVATESQIINISSRIAGIGATVGLTSDEVIGLSAALASLGVQPELAQGTVTRLFTKIQTAISDGGEALQNFGRLAGMSGQEFQNAWANDKTGTFLNLLNGINAQGPEAIAAIRSLGLSSVRDVPTILKLAQNTDIVAKSFGDAAEGARSGTALNNQYGKIAETTAAKLQVLVNNFQAFLAALGSSANLLGGVLDLTNDFLKWETEMASTPLGSTLALLVVGLVGVAGVGALAISMFLRFAASVAAVRTAAGLGAGRLGVLRVAMSVIRGEATTGAAANTTYAASENAIAASATKASVASRVLSAGLKGVGVAGIALMGLQLGSWLLGVAQQMQGVTQSADDMARAIRNGAKSSDLKQFQSTSNFWTGGNTLNVGKNGKTYTPSARQNIGSALSEFNKSNNFWGGDFSNFLGSSNLDPDIKKIQEYDQALAQLVSGGYADKAASQFRDVQKAAKDQGISMDALKAMFPHYEDALDGVTQANKKAGDSSETAGQQLSDSMSDWSDGIGNLLGIQNALYGLGETLGKGGDDFSYFTQSGRDNLAALQQVVKAYTEDAGGDSQILANELQGLFNAILASAPQAAGALSLIRDAISATGSTPNSAVPQIDLSSLIEGYGKGAEEARKAANSTRSLANEVHTLADYANDLSGVMQRAFEIRFGPQQSLDKISSAWSDIRKQAADAAKAMGDAQAKLLQLASDKQINQYWLSVANLYGDTLRAAQIQADLAQNAQDTADAQKDLKEAQDQASTSLTGNSDAAIANRSALLGLVSNYQDYLKALASSGADQDTLRAKAAQLKAEFVQQATQMGFNRQDVLGLAASFDDMTVAINNVPRKITVTADANPAIQALNEFMAKARSTVGSGVNVPITSTYNDAGAAKAARAAVIQAQISNILAGLHGGISPNARLLLTTRLESLRNQLNSGQYWTGGWTGSGGKYESRGEVHANEFVFSSPAVNAIGVNNLSRAHDAAISGQPFSLGSGFGGGVVTVQLSAPDRALLADAGNLQLVIPGVAIAKATRQSTVTASVRGEG